jgi:hypothetical protein
MRKAWADTGSRLMMKAVPPSEIGQQSMSLSGGAIGADCSTSSTRIGSRNCAPGWPLACWRINTASCAMSVSVNPYSCM